LNKHNFFLHKRQLALLFIIFLFLSCGHREEWHTSTLLYFDTLCEIKLRCSHEKFNSTLKQINILFSRIEELFSPGAFLSNSPELIELYEIARKVYMDSQGAFDISIAPLSSLWGFHNPPYRIPKQEEIVRVLKSVGLEKVKNEEGRLSIPPEMSFDWGGIAKGFGVDLASKLCRKNQILQGFINAGGDLFCWGKNPQGQLWRIGIKHPRKDGFLGVLSLSETGAATTGDYQRYFIQDDIRYHHVLDPKTGFPAKGNQSVTVVGPETVFCDALSTAVFVSSEPEKIMQKYSDYSAIIIDSKGKLTYLGKKINLDTTLK
jgi:thiamine biosynthesis lipoprotein